MRVVIVLLLVIVGNSFVFGQKVADNPNATAYTLEAQDTVSVSKIKLHSPSRATIYEALVPGLGHIYNKKAWHLPITYAAFGTTIFFIIDNTKKYQKYRDAYEDFSVYQKYLAQSPQYPFPIQEPTSQRFRKVLDADYSKFSGSQLETLQKAFKNNKDAFRRYRDLSYISFVAVYVLNIIWATVDAHFFYYDISDDLSLRLQPQMLVMQDYKRGIGMNIVLNF